MSKPKTRAEERRDLRDSWSKERRRLLRTPVVVKKQKTSIRRRRSRARGPSTHARIVP